ncbi:type I glyceraldehyde-3-phosphate dehydrogenase [Pseudomonadales bacterium]|nr:type I glyceraldehyde-3-phosphate dehydrogenase [Pseudomonadales bacterium]MDB4567588.1 type I glyceraldehyde-3-phosphate dehydrogenase [Pseudomonadales bacterium]
MTLRIAINGYGRIGRNIVRALYENPRFERSIEIVAINDLASFEAMAHLTQFDSTHGRFDREVILQGDKLCINEDQIQLLSIADPTALPWRALAVDVVLECSGALLARAQAEQHLQAGAGRVLVSAPGKDLDATLVYGVNEQMLKPEHRLISNASCTTNCLAPLCQTLDAAFGIESGLMTTIHAYTSDQRLNDALHDDLYRARAAAQSMIPTKTGAAVAIGEVLPQLRGRLDGLAVRVPTLNVSLVDLTFTAQRAVTAAEVNDLMRQAAANDQKGVLAYNDQPLVSVDFNHSPFSCNFDGNHTRVMGRLVKVLAWYDNEWGFSNRMLDQALIMGQAEALVVAA